MSLFSFLFLSPFSIICDFCRVKYKVLFFQLSRANSHDGRLHHTYVK